MIHPESINDFLTAKPRPCPCGREHHTALAFLDISPRAAERLPEALSALAVKRPLVVTDPNTLPLFERFALPVLQASGIPYTLRTLRPRPGHAHLDPDEAAVGALALHFDPACDGILSVGSGVITDICKVFSGLLRLRHIALATAPSMDGYASDSASMVRDGLKITLQTPCPGAVLCDARILATAPFPMLQAGLGDMVAKALSVAEWRIAHLVIGEYYCDAVAGLMRKALRKILDHAPGLAAREPEALLAVAEGLVLSGIAMSYAKVSRPASGLEHYFSHVWDMQALNRGQAHQLHGLQVGVGSVLALSLFDWLLSHPPTDLPEYPAFSQALWEDEVRAAFPGAADAMISTARATDLHNQSQRRQRGQIILTHWAAIARIAAEELRLKDELLRAMAALKLPLTPEELGVSQQDTLTAFWASRFLRDKYLLSTLIWDLGLTDRALHEALGAGQALGFTQL